MDGVAFQGMPRIALTPAEEARIPRPHSSASQVATAIPSTYTRTIPSSPSSPPRPHQYHHPHHKNRHNSITHHPYYNNNTFVNSNHSLAAQLGLTPSSSVPHIPISHNLDPYSRPSSPPSRPSTPQLHASAGSGVGATGTGGPGTSTATTTSATQEQEYPQNPQDSYYPQVPPSRSTSPGPSRLAFSLTPRPVRSPSPQLYNSPYDYHHHPHYQPRTSYFHRSSVDVQRRPGSPLGQDHQESWGGSSILMESPIPASYSEDDDDSDESGDGNDSDDEGEGNRKQHRRRRSTSRPRKSTSFSSKGGRVLQRLRESTSRISFGDDVSSALHRRTSHTSRTSQESERGARNSQDSLSLTSSRPGGGKEVHHDLSDEERQVEPRKSRSGWRPSLSLIRQESSSSNANQYYLQNDPGRIDAIPNNSRISFDINNNSNNLLSNISNISNAATNGLASNITNNDSNISKEKRRRRTKDTGKDSKKKRRRNRKKRAERLAQQQRQQQLLYEQRLAEQALHLPSLTPVLEKKTLYPLSYDDFEAYLRSQRAVEYLNFWADVTAHEQLCRTFDVSERRHKREQQLEERAIARDKRRTALLAAMEAGRFTPDPYLLAPGHYTVSPSTSAIGFGSGIGIGIGASGQDIHGSNMYATSRSSLQLPLNDHLSFPPETRRYGLHDSSTPFPPPSHPHSTTGSYNRLLTGAGGTGRVSGEMSRPSLEEEHISEQDAAVAAVAMRAQRNEYYPFNPSREDVRRGSFDLYQSLHGGGLTNMRYQHNNSSNGYVDSGLMPPPSSYSAPNAYNMMMRGRGSVDVRSRSNSRNSRSRPSVTEEYYGNGVRRMSSQQFQQQQNPHVSVHDENGHPHLSPPNGIQRTSQDEHGDSPEAAPVTTTDISLRQQTSQYSIEFAEPELGRRPSRARFGDGSVGPFQPSAAVRRSGESAYAPSHFSTGAMESKTILVQSFRTISLEDLQESALRIYRKYLIQLRTASMAAEEEAAAASADRDQYDNVVGRYKRSSVDKAMAMAPGWDGYAEEVIAQWNESWKGRSREARRSRQLSGRRSISTRGGTHDRDRETNGQPSAVSEETSSQLDRNSSDGGHGHGGGFNINTRAEDKDKDSEDDQSNDDEDKDSKERKTRRGREGKSSVPDSPKSPRLRKKTGTGLSAMLNPLFSRLIKTETTVVELPTLTINTTTIEEATAGDESDDEDEDEDEDEEYDEDEDYDSDEEDDDDDDKNNDENQNDDDDGDARKSQRHRKAMEENVAMDPGPLQPTVASTKDQGQYEVVVEVRDRSVPSLTPSHAQGSEQNQHQQMDQATPQNVTMESNDPENGMGTNNSETLAGSACTPRRQSTASTLSSSWDRIIKRDLDKQEAILPPPISTSLQPSPNRRSGLLGVRSTTGKATKSASRTARRVGSHLSALLNKSVRGGSSSSSLDIIPVTPATPRTNPQRLDNYRFQIPSIVMENPGEEKEFKDVNEKGDHSTLKDGHPLSMSASGANSSFVQLQGESMGTSAISEKVTDNSGIEGGSTLQPPKQILSPTTSSVQASISSSPVLSPTATTPALPRPSVSSPAAVAVSAAAAAFYLPLECRQRIHTQVQEEGRTNTPYLFGPAKGFVMDVVLDDHYYPMFLKYVERHNLGLLNRQHPNNVIKRKGMIWLGILIWLVVLGIQLMLVLMGLGGWSSPWVWVVGIVGGWTGSICLATGVKEFSPILGILGKMCEDRHLFRFRGIQEPSIRVRHRFRAYWMLSYCIFWSTIIMVVFAALPQRNINN